MKSKQELIAELLELDTIQKRLVHWKKEVITPLRAVGLIWSDEFWIRYREFFGNDNPYKESKLIEEVYLLPLSIPESIWIECFENDLEKTIEAPLYPKPPATTTQILPPDFFANTKPTPNGINVLKNFAMDIEAEDYSNWRKITIDTFSLELLEERLKTINEFVKKAMTNPQTEEENSFHQQSLEHRKCEFNVTPKTKDDAQTWAEYKLLREYISERIKELEATEPMKQKIEDSLKILANLKSGMLTEDFERLEKWVTKLIRNQSTQGIDFFPQIRYRQPKQKNEWISHTFHLIRKAAGNKGGHITDAFANFVRNGFEDAPEIDAIKKGWSDKPSGYPES